MSVRKTAVVAFADCGCVVAADLDGHKVSIDDYIRRKLGERWETPADAIKLLNASNCKHTLENRRSELEREGK